MSERAPPPGASRPAGAVAGPDLGQFQAVLDTIPFPFFSKGADLRYTSCNRAFEGFLGLPRSGIVGRTVWEIAKPQLAEVYDRADRELLAERGKQVYETRVTGADGVDRDVIFHKSVVVDASGAVAGIVGIYVDITERKRAEAAERELTEHLRRAQHLESVGQLAGGIAHDLNNLLSPILGYAEMLLEELPGGSDQAESVGEIRAAGERARDLIGRLLVLGRKHVLEPRPCDLGQVVGHVAKMLRGVLPEDVGLDLALPSAAATIRADALEIERVLVNLAMNARDAMPGGGVLRIAVSMPDPGEVLLEVSDTGTGMDAVTRERLFEPFFTTKAAGRGTGLGLATVYAVVQQHGGRIAFESAPGLGTTFRIALPADGAAPLSTRTPRADAAPPGGTETILLVEDDPSVRRMLQLALERQGYRVLAADTAERALELAGGEGPVDLLVTDVILPGMHGKALHAGLLASRPALPVLFLSGHDRHLVAERGVVEQGVQFLRKPVELRALVERVRGLLDG